MQGQLSHEHDMQDREHTPRPLLLLDIDLLLPFTQKNGRHTAIRGANAPDPKPFKRVKPAGLAAVERRQYGDPEKTVVTVNKVMRGNGAECISPQRLFRLMHTCQAALYRRVITANITPNGAIDFFFFIAMECFGGFGPEGTMSVIR